MRWRQLAGLVAMMAVAAIGAGSPAPVAAGTTAADAASTERAIASVPCSVTVGRLTSAFGGSHYAETISATTPLSVRPLAIRAESVYGNHVATLSGTMSSSRTPEYTTWVSGMVVLDGVLYYQIYEAYDDGVQQYLSLSRIGGGWGTFRSLNLAGHLYGLRNDGVLFRWTNVNGTWRNKTSYAGFGAVKSMTLISSTSTYETFLANTRTGSLITIHIPVTSPMRPVVKRVRQSTWQGFETLLAEPCGTRGTVVLGIDKDKETAYLYTFSHATGLTTPIRLRGKVPDRFPRSELYFHWSTGAESPVFGE